MTTFFPYELCFIHIALLVFILFTYGQLWRRFMSLPSVLHVLSNDNMHIVLPCVLLLHKRKRLIYGDHTIVMISWIFKISIISFAFIYKIQTRDMF